ncbi:MAG TPA: hypothetical protein VGL81_18860 [Polyangiaceae bacterium]|jgi:hypothetical protein
MRAFALLALAALAATGCGNSSRASGSPEGGAADASGDVEPGDASACAPDGEGLDAGSYPVPTPASIQFAAKAALPSGEQLLFNDWNPSPNTVSSLTPDGATKTPVFAVYRAWSMGVSHDAKSIAFSCGDPDQQADFGLQIGDSIQQTWIYDVASQAIHLVAHGNINDECHTFGPGDTALWVCRRYDFAETGDASDLTGTNKGYRIGWIELATGAFSFLTPDDSASSTYALYPQPTADGRSVYYSTTQDVSATQTRSTVLDAPLCGGATANIRDAAGEPVLSPDGTRYVYADETQTGALHASTLDGKTDVTITTAAGTNAVWSPDGTKVAYLVYDGAAGCQHIDVVKSDGSSAATPTRLRDCSKTGEFITELAWFVNP